MVTALVMAVAAILQSSAPKQRRLVDAEMGIKPDFWIMMILTRLARDTVLHLLCVRG